MKENIYYLTSIIIIFVLPFLLSFYLLDHIYLITLIAVFLLLFVLILDTSNPYQVYHSFFAGMVFIIVFLLLIKPESITALKISSTAYFPDLKYTTLSLDNPLLWWSGGQLSGNAIIAMVSIIMSLIFWLLGLVGLRTKKVLQGIVIFVGAVFFLECFYAFIAPAKAAQSIGWYRDAQGYLPDIGQKWALVPLQMLALIEYFFLAYSTVGMATTICVGFLFINDFIAAKTGIQVGK